MIDVKSLRVGSWVLFETNTGVFSPAPEQLTEKSLCNVLEGWLEKKGCDILPIHITPEILGKNLGLHRDSEGWPLSYDYRIYDPLVLNGVGAHSQANRDKWCLMHRSGLIIHNKAILYLHELQNLYYCLTKEELVFKI